MITKVSIFSSSYVFHSGQKKTNKHILRSTVAVAWGDAEGHADGIRTNGFRTLN